MSQEGFEPPTLWFVATCSSPLSYKPFYVKKGKQKEKKSFFNNITTLNFCVAKLKKNNFSSNYFYKIDNKFYIYFKKKNKKFIFRK